MKSLNQISMLGNIAPDFTLKDDSGKFQSLSDHRGSWVILYFYPKDMTAGCTLEAQEFRDHSYEIGDLNAVVLGISADDVASHKKFCQEQSLDFALLSDPQAEACRMYDVWGTKTIFGTKTEGIVRTTFLIDPEGKLQKIYSNVKPLGHASQVLKDLRDLQNKI